MYNQAVFSIFGYGVYMYGICMAVGIICCFAFLIYAMDYIHCNDETVNKMLFFGIVATAFGIFMAAVFQGLYDYIANPSGGFSLSGLTFYGGLIGGVAGFVIIYNIYIWLIAPHCKGKVMGNHMNAGVTDGLSFIPIAIGIAHSFGRLGCTFAGCCYGAETDAWYGIFMHLSGGRYATVIPTQLFECLFIVALTIVMAILYFKFKFQYNMGLYCIAYGVFRFLIEYARDDNRGEFVAGLTPSQFWAIVMVVIGIAYFFVHRYVFTRFMKHPENTPLPQERLDARARADEAASKKVMTGGTMAVLIAMGVTLVAVTVGVCVNFSGSGNTVFRLGNALASSGYSNAVGLNVFAYLTLSLVVLLLVMYAAKVLLVKRYHINSRAYSYVILGFSVAAIICGIVTLMLSNTLHIGTSNVLNSMAGAWLVTLSGICCGTAGLFGALKRRT